MNLYSIDQILQDRCHVSSESRIAVGVSGGADSVALLHILKSLGYSVIALHFNHQIRPEADQDAEHVRRLMDRLQIRCEILAENVPQFALENRLSLEEAARIRRYQFLFEFSRKLEADVLATAHHANDQAETILMHFIRGAGLDGLKGMTFRGFLPDFDSCLPLIRPLLDTPKTDLVDYCTRNNLDYVEDFSNKDSTYFRNWLRLDLIPKIESINPGFQQTIIRSSRSLQADYEAIDHLVDVAWDELGIREGNGYLAVEVDRLTRFDRGIRYRIIRKAIRRLKNHLRDIDYDLVDMVDQFLFEPPQSRRLDLGAGLDVYLEGSFLYLVRHGYSVPVKDFPQIMGDVNLEIPCQKNLQDGWRILAEEMAADEVPYDVIQTSSRWEGWLDMDRITPPIRLTSRTPGDRFTPLGVHGHSLKISDLFINHKIPATARPAYPVLRDTEMILWVPGIQIANPVRVTTTTRRILHMRVVRSGN